MSSMTNKRKCEKCGSKLNILGIHTCIGDAVPSQVSEREDDHVSCDKCGKLVRACEKCSCSENTQPTGECVFCNLSKIESEITDYGDVITFVPLNPVANGHILVVPKLHVKDFSENPQISAKVMQVAAEIVQEYGGHYNLITSKGKNATHSVNHLHIHLVRRTENDGLLLPWSDISFLSSHEKVIKEIEDLNRDAEHGFLGNTHWDDGYNQAISDVLAHLKSNLK